MFVASNGLEEQPAALGKAENQRRSKLIIKHSNGLFSTIYYKKCSFLLSGTQGLGFSPGQAQDSLYIENGERIWFWKNERVNMRINSPDGNDPTEFRTNRGGGHL